MIALIWAVPLFLSYWNVGTISATMENIKAHEVFKIDELFWEYNADNVAKILKQKDDLILETVSLKLGILSVQNDLSVLTAQNGFKDVRFVSASESGGVSGVPIRLSFNGLFEGIFPWLQALKNELPYLMIRELKISTDPVSNLTDFQLELQLRYRLSANGNTA